MARGNFGERLKRERELREVSLKEVTVATRIGPRYLEALENEEWDKLPGGIFNRGFVRSIARYLGLDEENLLAEYDLAYGEQAPVAPLSHDNRIPRPPIWIPLLALLGVLVVLAGLILGGIYGWRRYSAHRAARKSAASAALPPLSAAQSTKPAPRSVAATPSEISDPSPHGIPLDLSVSTSAATRVRIVADRALLLDAEFPSGETRHFSAKEQFEVTAGDSSAVLLELNGQAMPPVGTPGSSGTIVLSQRDLKQASGGTPQP
ncbi:MAG TPA: RodZ domain-containing protein [Candidatus Acidoferrum sp.]|nr:RodZ domain-containing protein [Candidatus Acidoferrum sp.]